MIRPSAFERSVLFFRPIVNANIDSQSSDNDVQGGLLTTILNWGTINDVQHFFRRPTTTWYISPVDITRFTCLYVKVERETLKFTVYLQRSRQTTSTTPQTPLDIVISVKLNLISTELVVRLRHDKTTRWSHSRLRLVATSLSPKPLVPPISPLLPLRTRCPALFAILLRCIAVFQTGR